RQSRERDQRPRGFALGEINIELRAERLACLRLCWHVPRIGLFSRSNDALNREDSRRPHARGEKRTAGRHKPGDREKRKAGEANPLSHVIVPFLSQCTTGQRGSNGVPIRNNVTPPYSRPER